MVARIAVMVAWIGLLMATAGETRH